MVTISNGVNQLASLTSSGNALIKDDWSHVAWGVSWDQTATESTCGIWLNTEARGEATWSDIFIDSSSYTHLIGAENDYLDAENAVKGGWYSGFVWSFCVYNTAVNTFTDVGGVCTGTAECKNCPPDPDPCLIDCEKD
jgi:hypothetical protein